MNTNELFSRYENAVRSNPEDYLRAYKEVREKVENSSARYLGEPIEFLFQPMFLAEEDLNEIKGVLDKLTGVLDKTICRFREDEAFREVFPFPEEEEKLVLADPGYGNPYPIGRFDVFFDFAGNLQFCEFNTDGSAGMNEARVLQRIIGGSRALDVVPDGYEAFTYSPMENLIDKILHNYRNFPGTRGDPGTVAIVDFEGEGISSEFREFQRKFRERGYDTVIADPRELEYNSGKLLYDSKEIGLVYRRATTRKVVDRLDEVRDFTRAYREGAVPVVGGFSSQIVHNKALFAILQEEDFTGYLNEEEKEFVHSHLPDTYIYDRHPGEVRERLLQNKDKYLLKPFDKFAGHGVYVGRDLSGEEWENRLEEVAGKNYIAQRFCDVPKRNFLYFDEEELSFHKFGYLIGLYLYNQELGGLYTRAGRENVIASLVECFSLPTFVARENS
ncbi:glutathionylspermidine synthase family protein [Candidatus Bipolaricaulota bacterium]|nr:glutathionylspermidine synthase family protein [Candidatus Bipolaricaulota bacterium]